MKHYQIDLDPIGMFGPQVNVREPIWHKIGMAGPRKVIGIRYPLGESTSAEVKFPVGGGRREAREEEATAHNLKRAVHRISTQLLAEFREFIARIAFK